MATLSQSSSSVPTQLSPAGWDAWIADCERAAMDRLVVEGPEPFEPEPIAEVWWSGFGIGRDGIPAKAPDHLDELRAREWLLGYDAGYGNWEAEMEAWAAEAEDLASLVTFEPEPHQIERIEVYGGDVTIRGGGL